MRAEKEAVRKRKAQRLTRQNRELINEVDLKEPQMREETPARWSVEDAVFDYTVDQIVDHELNKAALAGMSETEFIADQLHQKLMRASLNVPVIIDGPGPRNSTAQPEPPTEPATEPNLEETLTHELIEALDHIEAPQPVEDEEETPAIVLWRPGRGGHKPAITPETRREVAEAYRQGLEVDEICRAYDIGVGTLYRIVRLAGLSRRQRSEEEPVTATKTSPAVSVDGTASGLTEWIVTYTVTRTETTTVSARSFNDAANAVSSEQPDVEVVSVARART
jgi:transposase-like protein